MLKKHLSNKNYCLFQNNQNILARIKSKFYRKFRFKYSSDFLNHGMIPYLVLGKNIILTPAIKLYEPKPASKAILPY